MDLVQRFGRPGIVAMYNSSGFVMPDRMDPCWRMTRKEFWRAMKQFKKIRTENPAVFVERGVTMLWARRRQDFENLRAAGYYN